MNTPQRWQLLAILLFIGVLLYLLGPVLTPFAMAALLAWLGDPLVDRLERCGLARGAAVALVFAAIIMVILLAPLILLPLLEAQIGVLIAKLPVYAAWIRERLLPLIVERLGIDPAVLAPERLIALVQAHWQQAGGIATQLIAQVTQSGLALLGWVMNLLLIPVVTFYFLRDWDRMVERVRELLPRHIEPKVSQIARESDQVLSAFLRGQLLVMLALGLVYSIGLWLAGIQLAFLIGMGAGLLSFVPYLGTIIGLGAAVIAALVEHRDLIHVVYVLLVFGAGQLLEGFVLTPWLVGDRIGLHPVAVIFAILAGGQLFGFVGVLIALPVSAVLVVILRHLHEHYVQSALYGPATPGRTPPERRARDEAGDAGDGERSAAAPAAAARSEIAADSGNDAAGADGSGGH